MTMIVETAEEAASICSTRESSLAEMEDQEILKEVNADHCRLSLLCWDGIIILKVLVISMVLLPLCEQVAEYWTRQRPACGEEAYWWVDR